METIETNIIDELKSCQNYHDYKRFVKKYSGIEDAVIKKLVEEASIKMENTKIRAYKISHNYRKGTFCDMTKLSSMILYVDYERQKIIMKDSRKGVVMDIDYRIFTNSTGRLDCFHCCGGGRCKIIEISSYPNHLYCDSGYYKISIDKKKYLAKESYYVQNDETRNSLYMEVNQSDTKRIDTIFMLCVHFLQWLAKKLGMTYNEVNVWLFCVICPLVTLVSILLNIYLLMK